MRRRRYLATLATGATAGLAGCGVGGGDTPDGDHDVGMGATTFTPRSVTVTAGGTVVWRNTNSRAHTVTAYGARIPDGADYWATGGFETETAARDGFFDRLDGGMSTGDTFTHTFETPGEHHYFCIPHERAGMVGVVVVEP